MSIDKEGQKAWGRLTFIKVGRKKREQQKKTEKEKPK